MNFDKGQGEGSRHAVGFGTVVLLHVLVGWALVSGLGKKIVEVIKAPIETKVIEEVKEIPPPPEVVLPPPPKMEAPPPPFVPPPEIQVAAPAPSTTAISTTSTTPPPATDIRPVQPPAPPAPKQGSVSTFCKNIVKPEVPREMIKNGEFIEGSLKVKLTIEGGKVSAVEPVSASPGVWRAWQRSVRTATSNYQCQSDGKVEAVQEWVFKLED